MKYAHYDETTGKLLGWYDPEIHANPPQPYIKVTDEDHAVWFSQGLNYVDASTGKMTIKDFRTQAEIIEAQKKEINIAIQSHLDTTAQSYRYDNIMSARSYAGYANPFQSEAQKLAIWAADCWVMAGTIEADVLSGARPMPSSSEVIAELPKLVM